MKTSLTPIKTPDVSNDKIKEMAQKMESNFLYEFLKLSGVNEEKDPLTGNKKTNQFSTFFNEVYAKRIAQSGGIGLKQKIELQLREFQQRASSE